ncbi:MAG TPA: helix-turn-helix domain-containing protein [Nitrospiraceae bacterium]|jgi:excisionase family DNA binding protein|nr:helix-turn-helix domain-containing protein [Nitrospiraceae bacterium]
MTLLTIDEAARFLRLTKRTLYQRPDIPRVRYGHRVMFIEEDLERWVRAQREVEFEAVDASKLNGYHRNPLFSSGRS